MASNPRAANGAVSKSTTISKHAKTTTRVGIPNVAAHTQDPDTSRDELAASRSGENNHRFVHKMPGLVETSDDDSEVDEGPINTPQRRGK